MFKSHLIRLQIAFVKGVLVKGTGIGKAKQANEPMAHGIGKLWAIYKNFGPLR